MEVKDLLLALYYSTIIAVFIYFDCELISLYQLYPQAMQDIALIPVVMFIILNAGIIASGRALWKLWLK